MSRHNAALPIAYVVLRLLILLNWLVGAAILLLLVLNMTSDWLGPRALGIEPSAETMPLIWGMRAVALLGLVAVPFNHLVLSRLVAMVLTVRAGDPFVAANAARLRAIAWALLALQLLSIVIGAIGKAVSTPDYPLALDAGFSASGWVAVLMAFVLASVFAEGTAMREELEGTV